MSRLEDERRANDASVTSASEAGEGGASVTKPQPAIGREPLTETEVETAPVAPRPRNDPCPGQQATGSTFSPGQVVAGRYTIVRLLGRGGMGEVYEAQDSELRERVALKTIRPQIAADRGAIERFKKEIHLARKVTHPNVCRVLELGYHLTGEPGGSETRLAFLTMELLSGETLSGRLKRTGRMTTTEAFPLVSQMAAGLSAAHEVGIVHRDFKSANVILATPRLGEVRQLTASEHAETAYSPPGSREAATKGKDAGKPALGEANGMPAIPEQQAGKIAFPEGIRAVVTDFGLARRTAVGEETFASTDGGGGIAGTPAYMAPEQVKGVEATAAADIYALGLVIYEMMTGMLPFIGDTPLSTAMKRLEEAPVSPRAHAPDLDPKWEAAILRCLERNPADRFQNAADVVKALAGEVATPGRKQRRLALVGLVLLALLASALAYRLRVRRRLQESPKNSGPPIGLIRPRRAVAVLGFNNLAARPEAAWLSTALSEMLSTELAAGEQLRTIPGENVARMKIDLSLPDADGYAPETLSRIRKNLGADDVVLGSYVELGQGSNGRIRLDLRVQDTVTRETVCAVSESGTEGNLFELVSKAGGDLRRRLGAGAVTAPEAASIRSALPFDPKAARLYAEGLNRLRVFDALGARGLLEKAVAAEPNYPLAHSALADALTRLGYEEKAKEEAKRAFDLSVNLSREDRLSVEARYRETTNEWDKAVELYRTLFNLYPDNLDYGLQMVHAQRLAGKGKDAFVTLEALRRLPPPARDDPRIDLAEATAAYSLADFKREQAAAARAAEEGEALGAPLLVARAQLDQCWALQNRGQYKEARAACEKANKAYARTGDRDGVAEALLYIGPALYYEGDLAGAQSAFEQALAAYRHVGNKSGMSVALNNIANVLSGRGDHLGAERRYEQVLAISREIGSKYGTGLALTNMALELRVTGNLSEARATFHEALARCREIGQEDFEASNLNGLGNTLYLQGHLGDSQKILDQALEICRRIDSKQICGEALSNLGNLLKWEGSLDPGRAKYQEALAVRNQIGAQLEAAQSRVSVAELSIEEGHAGDAEAPAREAREAFRKQKLTEQEIWADTVLARALLGQGKSAEARREIDAASPVAAKLQNEEVRLEFGLAAASVRAASGKPADLAVASRSLEATLADATKHGYLGYQFEARLALGEIQMKSGHTSAGRARLEALEKDAKAKGFGLFARKAIAAARQGAVCFSK